MKYTTLDGLGNRKVEQTFAAGAITASTTLNRQFDKFGRLWKVLNAANQEVQVYAYDEQGNPDSVTAKPDAGPAHNQVTSYTLYDPLNRLATLKDALLGVTNYGYDGLDHLASVKDPRLNTTSYTTNGIDNQTSEVSPDRGTISNPVFDEAGNLKTSTDARGKTTQYTYDALNRVLSETYADGSSVNYQYDQGIGAKGKLNHIDDSTGSTDWIYDAEARLVQKNQTTGTVSKSLSYSYDLDTGHVATLTYPSGAVVTYAYNAAGRVQTLSLSTNAQAITAILSNILYRPLGPLASYQLPTVTGLPTINRGYNADGQLTSYSLADAEKTLQRDRLGNILNIR